MEKVGGSVGEAIASKWLLGIPCLLKVFLSKLLNEFLIAKSDCWVYYTSILAMLQMFELFIIPSLEPLFSINCRVIGPAEK